MKVINKDEIKAQKIQKDKFLKEDLEKYYIIEKRTLFEISKIYECGVDTIKRKLNKYKIPIRPYGAFSVDSNGKTLSSKYKNGEISAGEYQNKKVKQKGYENYGEYINELVKNKGYEDINDYNQKMNYKKGKGTGLSMSENKKSPAYLGVHICENKEFLSKIINIVENMPNNNPGYDVVCGKNKKIDVKCGCLINDNVWTFRIEKNKIADYFLMIAFDNRDDLNIIHIWLVKGDDVIEKTSNYLSKEFIFNETSAVSINKGNEALKRWIKHEITDIYKLKEVQKMCNDFRNNNESYKIESYKINNEEILND